MEQWIRVVQKYPESRIFGNTPRGNRLLFVTPHNAIDGDERAESEIPRDGKYNCDLEQAAP